MDTRLGAGAIALYKLALENPRWTRSDAMEQLGVPSEALGVRIATLSRLRLLRSALDADREFDAVSPQTAVAELLCDEEQDMLQRQRELASIREDLLSLLPTYFTARRQEATEIIEVVPGQDAVREAVEGHIAEASREVRIAQAFSGAGEAKHDLFALIVGSLKLRGQEIETHLLLQQSWRWAEPLRHHLAAARRSGIEIRTVPAVDRMVMVVDNDVLLVAKDDVDHTVLVVREPTVVGVVGDAFAYLWRRGNRIPLDGDDDGDMARRDMSRVILEQMADGLKDEMIARRLGISLRTCRRHVAALMEELGARSRFQAGVMAYRRGLLD